MALSDRPSLLWQFLEIAGEQVALADRIME
jgi:hypothetical protein